MSLKLFKKLVIIFTFVFSVSLPLVASADDFTFNWAKSIGSTGNNDFINYTQVGVSGSVYVSGVFTGTVDMDPGPGVSNLTSVASSDYFVAKFDASGNFVWAKDVLATATTSRSVYTLWVDPSENVYITGYFRALTDFDPGPGVLNIPSVGLNDMFITKLDSSGNLVWTKTVGSTSNDFGYSVITDSSNNVYITGGFSATADFDPGVGVFNITPNGIDAFILKLDSSGNFLWAKSVGGASDDRGHSISLDSSGNPYITGFFGSTVDFDPDVGTYNLTSSGGKDIYVLKLDSSGNFLWAKSMGGTSDDIAQSVIVDSSDNFYLKGEFSGTSDFDPGSDVYNLTSVKASDVFVSKLSSSGLLIWAKSVPTTIFNTSWGRHISVDSYGNFYLTGSFSGTVDFNLGPGVYNLTSAGSDDLFLLKLDSSGNFLWVKTVGSNSDDGAYSVSIDSSNNLYLGGYFNGTVDFDFGAGITNLVSAGSYDSFIAKFNFLDTTAPTITLNGSGSVILFVGDPYVDQGATATDAVDGNLTGSIVTTSNVDLNTPGFYTVTYTVSDTASNSASVSRLVTVYRHNNARPLNLQINTGSQTLPISTPPTSQTVTKFLFTKNLKHGMKDQEVLELQKYLNSHASPISTSGVGSLGKETTYFGLATKSALIKYQKANNIVPSIGFFGPTTRAYVNQKI